MTSTEWFSEMNDLLTIDFLEDKLTKVEFAIRKTNLLNEAKELHRREVVNAYYQGGVDFQMRKELHNQEVPYQGDAETYYSEKFKIQQ